MLNEEIYNKWSEFVEEYEEYMMTFEEQWYSSLQQVKDFMDEYNKKPTINDNKILCQWIGTQLKNYKNKTYIMLNEIIYNKWTEFVEEYKEYMMTNEELWHSNLQQVKDYINNNNKRPSPSNNKILCSWLQNQIIYYKNKQYTMSNEEIYNKWTEFVEEYKEYMMTNEEIWYSNLQQVKDFMNENKKRPSPKGNKILCYWFQNQLNNYKKKTQIMSNEEIYNKWTDFVEEYNRYF
jgi:hypothetical protein